MRPDPLPPGRRPRLHLTAPRGWINDPLGLTWHDDRYHLFFQSVPEGTDWEPACSWGHATSRDLFTWTHQQPALRPGDGDDGCWSGSVVVREDGEAFLFYTSVSAPDLAIGRVRSARPDDSSWSSWTKGPVVAQLPDGTAAVACRDPFVLADGGRWRMVVGGGLQDGSAVALSWSSDDLEHWAYDGVLASRSSAQREPVWTGAVWECPQLVRLGDRHVLVVSVWEREVLHVEACAVGTYGDGVFTAASWGRLTWGPSYYAGAAFSDREGRPGVVHWLRGTADPAGGWAGALSVPHLLELRGDRVGLRPHPDLDGLRTGTPQVLAGPGRVTVPSTCDLEWQLRPGAGHALELSSGGALLLSVTVADGLVQLTTEAGSWDVPSADALRLLVDGPLCELFVDGRALAVPLACDGGPLDLVLRGEGELHVHQLAVPAP